MANKVSDSVAASCKQSRNERIEEFLREHYAFRYNTVKSRAEFRSSDGEFLPVTKYRLNSFRRELDRTIGISTSAENLRSMLESDFSERVNPVQAYFHKLPLVTGTQAIDITDPADTYYRDQIPYIPWHSGSAILALFYKGWGLNYSFIYTGQRTTSRRTSRATTPNRGTRATSRCKRLSRSAPEPSRPRPRLTIFSDRITTWCSTIRCRRPTSGSSSASISNLREP